MNRFIILLFALALFSCQKSGRVLPYYDSADFTPRWELPADNEFHQIRAFSLINQENQEFTEADMDGKISVVDFFFTSCPGICPKLTSSMTDLQREFLDNDDILLLSHSVTPDYDNAAVLKEYASNHGVNFKRWKLLTGDRSEIYDLGRKYYFVEEDEGLAKDEEVFLHTENFVLVDKKRHIRGIYNGLDPNSIQSLIADIKELEKE
ncbi:SCO family protein [Pontibacter sp. JH31]|uniref:SCO family protein n=1 Tax=Pontibacter aquaedesilientis TaxID=2766980 RepID=A0ABR7XHC0_9BACT|nr:SCO family protein [Pontibacter aquaedesilientis]MBD1397682.1 SCO family protein [Pontibacter aquaedesilientis]